MEGYLRLGLMLVVVIVVALFVLKVSNRRSRRFQTTDIRVEKELAPITNWNDYDWQEDDKHRIGLPSEVSVKQQSTHVKKNPALDIISIQVAAKPGCYFAAYDLLQAISATGMHFGAMNIFHYYLTNANGDRYVLFSLASSTEPGEFDLDKMGDFTCAGLTLFMNLYQVPNAEQAFALMLEAAEQLADDLDGNLLSSHHIPLTEELISEYQTRIYNYQTTL